MSLLALIFAGSLSASAQGTPCPEQVSTAMLAQHISAADLAFSSMDENAFRTARWSAQRSLRCMGEAIQTGQAAAYYRMEALGSFLDQNHAQTVGFFKSMLRVAPHYILPEPMAPSGHPLRIDFEVAQGTAHVLGDPVPSPADGVIRVDGGVATEFLEEASRHQAYRRKIVVLFLVISLILFFMQSYGGDIPSNASIYFYVGYLSTPLFISGFISSICYVLMRKPPKQVRRLNKYFKD